MARDESKTQEVKNIIDDLMGWLALSPEQLEETVIVAAGDQMTTDRVRRMQDYLQTSIDSSIFETRRFVLPLTGWWHEKWAAQKVSCPLIQVTLHVDSLQRLHTNSLGTEKDYTSLLRDFRTILSRASTDRFSDTHEAFAKIRSARGSHLFEYVPQHQAGLS